MEILLHATLLVESSVWLMWCGQRRDTSKTKEELIIWWCVLCSLIDLNAERSWLSQANRIRHRRRQQEQCSRDCNRVNKATTSALVRPEAFWRVVVVDQTIVLFRKAMTSMISCPKTRNILECWWNQDIHQTILWWTKVHTAYCCVVQPRIVPGQMLWLQLLYWLWKPAISTIFFHPMHDQTLSLSHAWSNTLIITQVD